MVIVLYIEGIQQVAVSRFALQHHQFLIFEFAAMRDDLLFHPVDVCHHSHLRTFGHVMIQFVDDGRATAVPAENETLLGLGLEGDTVRVNERFIDLNQARAGEANRIVIRRKRKELVIRCDERIHGRVEQNFPVRFANAQYG